MTVLYYPAAKGRAVSGLAPGVAYAATVASVSTGGALTLNVLGSDGNAHAIDGVPFVQSGATPPKSGNYAVPQANLSIVTDSNPPSA